VTEYHQYLLLHPPSSFSSALKRVLTAHLPSLTVVKPTKDLSVKNWQNSNVTGWVRSQFTERPVAWTHTSIYTCPKRKFVYIICGYLKLSNRDSSVKVFYAPIASLGGRFDYLSANHSSKKVVGGGGKNSNSTTGIGFDETSSSSSSSHFSSNDSHASSTPTPSSSSSSSSTASQRKEEKDFAELKIALASHAPSSHLHLFPFKLLQYLPTLPTLCEPAGESPECFSIDFDFNLIASVTAPEVISVYRLEEDNVDKTSSLFLSVCLSVSLSLSLSLCFFVALYVVVPIIICFSFCSCCLLFLFLPFPFSSFSPSFSFPSFPSVAEPICVIATPDSILMIRYILLPLAALPVSSISHLLFAPLIKVETETDSSTTTTKTTTEEEKDDDDEEEEEHDEENEDDENNNNEDGEAEAAAEAEEMSVEEKQKEQSMLHFLKNYALTNVPNTDKKSGLVPVLMVGLTHGKHCCPPPP
jgi:hypothetical protein